MQQLSHREKLVFNLLKHSKPSGAWALGIQTVINEPRVYKIRNLIRELLISWDEHAENMVIMLDFDLPKLLNVKLYKPDLLNEIFSKQNFPFRAIETVSFTFKDARWIAQTGYFFIEGGGAGTVYVDSCLRRFVRLSNGQIFHCTNSDLLGMKSSEKVVFKAYLTGLID